MNPVPQRRFFRRARALAARALGRRYYGMGFGHLRAVVENLAEGLILSGADGQLIHWNRAALRMHGFANMDECLCRLADFNGVYQISTLEGEILEFDQWPLSQLMRGQPVRDLILRVRRVNENWERIFRYGGGAVRTPHGKRLIFLTIIDDTERERMREMQARTQKMEALGTLAGGIAHDFNNMIAAIAGNAHLAAADLPPDHPAQESLAEIAKAGKRAADLIRRILVFSRPEELKRVPIDLAPIVHEALKLLRASLPTTIAIRTDFAADLPPAAADVSHIHQILLNLMTNAAQAIGTSPGSIDVGLEAMDVAADLAGSPAGDLPEGRYVRLRVRDDGCGMDAAVLARIFDPFFTTRQSEQGTGLGLSVVHGIMKSCGGAVTVYSQAGMGTVFNLYFPVAEPGMTSASAPLAQPLPTAGGRGERILYVDDEAPLVQLATRLLQRLGYKVSGFTDPALALDTLLHGPQDFDAVITDLTMPGKSGFELAREIAAVRPDLPVLLTSGYVRPEDRATAQRIGIRAVIPKPDGVESLGHALDRVFGHTLPPA